LIFPRISAVQAGFDVQAVTDAPQMNKDIDNRLKKLDAVPGWILRLYEEIDTLNFGSGFELHIRN
jgi:hypothetical protein